MLMRDHVLYSCDGTTVWWSGLKNETPSLVALSKVSLLLNVLKASWNHLVCWHAALLLKQEVKGSSCLFNELEVWGRGILILKCIWLDENLHMPLMSLIFKRKKLHFVSKSYKRWGCFHGGDLKTNRRGLTAANQPLLLFRLHELETKLRNWILSCACEKQEWIMLLWGPGAQTSPMPFF